MAIVDKEPSVIGQHIVGRGFGDSRTSGIRGGGDLWRARCVVGRFREVLQGAVEELAEILVGPQAKEDGSHGDSA